MRAAWHELRLVLIALGFLTRVPLPQRMDWRDEWLQASARHFPVVGLAVGACAAAVLTGGAALWSLPVALLLSMGATLALTGAFHEDGLADTFDALGGPAPRERALAIMKDSRLGTYGSTALIATLALKFAALTALGTEAAAALLLAHGVSRAAPVLVMRWLPYAGDADAAKAKPLARQMSRVGVGVALAWAAAISAGIAATGALGAVAVALALAAAMLTAWLTARWFRRRLGGFTGDTLGATQQLSELVIYLALAARVA